MRKYSGNDISTTTRPALLWVGPHLLLHGRLLLDHLQGVVGWLHAHPARTQHVGRPLALTLCRSDRPLPVRVWRVLALLLRGTLLAAGLRLSRGVLGGSRRGRAVSGGVYSQIHSQCRHSELSERYCTHETRRSHHSAHRRRAGREVAPAALPRAVVLRRPAAENTIPQQLASHPSHVHTTTLAHNNARDWVQRKHLRREVRVGVQRGGRGAQAPQASHSDARPVRVVSLAHIELACPQRASSERYGCGIWSMCGARGIRIIGAPPLAIMPSSCPDCFSR